METRRFVEGYLGSEFPSIYNQCGLNGALKSKDVKFLKNAFFEKRKLSKFCSEHFCRLTDRRVVFEFREI